MTPESQARLIGIAAGTPAGELLRRYWHPVATAFELHEDPVRTVRILGEELVLYRDRSGRLGLIGPRCAHRMVHMELGIPDEAGLRCPYHGWCYDDTGACVDTPLEPAESPLKTKVRLPAYPVQELGGLIFAYLGPAPAPALPRWDFLVRENSIRQVAVAELECHWLQCHENSGDPMHNVYLHGEFFRYQLDKLGVLEERAPDRSTHRAFTSLQQTVGFERIVVEIDEYGMHKGMKYSKDLGAPADSIGWFPYNVFPYYSRATSGVRTQVNIRVPLDDTHTRQYTYLLYHAPGVPAPEQEVVPSFVVPRVDERGKRILDFVHGQDIAAWEAQGPITDRTQEHLGTTDRGVLAYRRLFLEQVARVEQGLDPMNVFRDDSYGTGSIELSPAIGHALNGVAEGETAFAHRRYRERYHLGYSVDDIDRYAPAAVLQQVKQLMADADALYASRSERVDR